MKNDFEGLKSMIFKKNVNFQPNKKIFTKENSNGYIKCKTKFDSLRLSGKSKKERVIYPANCVKKEDDKTNRVDLNNSILNQSNIYDITKESILKIEKLKSNNNLPKRSHINANNNNFLPRQDEFDFFEMYRNLENTDKKFSVLSDKINRISRYDNIDEKAILSYLNRENNNSLSNKDSLNEKRKNRKDEDLTKRTPVEKPVITTVKEVIRKAPEDDSNNLEKFKLRQNNIYDYHMKFKELEYKLDSLTRKQDKFLI